MIGFARVTVPGYESVAFFDSPRLTGAVKRFLPDGARVALLLEEGAFYYAAYGDAFGYVRVDCVTLEGDEPHD